MIWKSREIIVFVSSPGDCLVERRTVRRIVEEMNERPELVSQRLRFKPLLWEDLPPGVAESGDFQKRINSVIKESEFGGYGIYIGIMKNRLGTPTPRYASGTIEEFEVSLKRRGIFGMPAEIMFYFVDDGSEPNSDVESFKSQASKKALLYTTVPFDAFAKRFEHDLLSIAKSWSKWRSILRRAWRPLRNYTAVVAALAVLLIAGYDLNARQRIHSALAAGRIDDAGAIWSERRSLMVFSAQAKQRQISAKIEDSFTTETHASDALIFWERWQSETVLLPHAHAAMQARLVELITGEIDRDLLNNRSAAALATWRETRRVGVWVAYLDKAHRTIADIAALRMIEALSATGTGPETWRDTLLTPLQAEQLHLIAEKIVAHDPTFRTRPNRAVRTALAVMADRMEILGELARQAAQTLDTHVQPEIEAFTVLADLNSLSAWIETTVSPTLKSHITYRIIEGVQSRKEPAAMLMMYEMGLRDQFPDPGVALLSDVPLAGEALEAQVTDFLNARIGGPPLHLAVLEGLLPHLDVSDLSFTARTGLTDLITAEIEDGMPPIVLDALSRLNTQRGHDLVDTELEEHLSGRTSFGFAHREVLMRHIRRTVPVDQRLEIARLLYERSESDRALLETPHSLSTGLSIANGVERGYLEILTLDASLATEADQAALARIVDKRALGLPTGPLAGVSRTASTATFGEERDLQALGAALRVLPEDWSIDILNLPQAPLVDPPWDPAWATRQIVIAALSSASGPALERVAQEVLRALPNDEDLEKWLVIHVATIGPETSGAFARHRLKDNSRIAIDMLVLLRDDDTILAHVNRIASAKAPRDDLAYLAEAASNLPANARRALIARIMETLPGEADHFLELAAEDGLVAEPLQRAAELLIRMPETGQARLGLRYFANTESERAWFLATQSAFRSWLDRVEPFEWVGVMQELPSLGPNDLTEAVVELAVARPIVTGFSIGGFQEEDPSIGQMAIGPDVGVVSHALARLATSNHSRVALDTLARTRIDKFQTLGNVPDPERTARAYITWLAVGPTGRTHLDCAPDTWLGADQLDDADPLTVRVAASLLLAQPRLATLPACRSEVQESN